MSSKRCRVRGSVSRNLKHKNPGWNGNGSMCWIRDLNIWKLLVWNHGKQNVKFRMWICWVFCWPKFRSSEHPTMNFLSSPDATPGERKGWGMRSAKKCATASLTKNTERYRIFIERHQEVPTFVHIYISVVRLCITIIIVSSIKALERFQKKIGSVVGEYTSENQLGNIWEPKLQVSSFHSCSEEPASKAVNFQTRAASCRNQKVFPQKTP